MKILFIVPGSGDSFYCGNCFRDSLHAGAMRRAGHDVTVMPLYLPLVHESFKADTPLFFPAVSYYMARKLFGRKSPPRAMERILNSKFMLVHFVPLTVLEYLDENFVRYLIICSPPAERV